MTDLHNLIEQQRDLLCGKLSRMVENQEQVATRRLVDNAAEHDLLESILEESKPPYHLDTPDGMDYRLKTPFRYPPLKYGSRFGTINEAGIFYGGIHPEVVIAEVAYYRFVYWYSPQEPFPQPIQSQHTLYSARFKTDAGVDLTGEAFTQYKELLTSPSDYRFTQQLGSLMRQQDIEAFIYQSARDPQAGACIALFTPEALDTLKPDLLADYMCDVDGETVSMRRNGQFESLRFALSDFQIDHQLPMPA